MCKVEKVRSTFHTFHDYLNFWGEKKDDGLFTIYFWGEKKDDGLFTIYYYTDMTKVHISIKYMGKEYKLFLYESKTK